MATTRKTPGRSASARKRTPARKSTAKKQKPARRASKRAADPEPVKPVKRPPAKKAPAKRAPAKAKKPAKPVKRPQAKKVPAKAKKPAKPVKRPPAKKVPAKAKKPTKPVKRLPAKRPPVKRPPAKRPPVKRPPAKPAKRPPAKPAKALAKAKKELAKVRSALAKAKKALATKRGKKQVKPLRPPESTFAPYLEEALKRPPLPDKPVKTKAPRQLEEIFTTKEIVPRNFISSTMVNKRRPDRAADVLANYLERAAQRSRLDIDDLVIHQHGVKFVGHTELDDTAKERLSHLIPPGGSIKFADTKAGTEVYLFMGSAPKLIEQLHQSMTNRSETINRVYDELIDYWDDLEWYTWAETDEPMSKSE